MKTEKMLKYLIKVTFIITLFFSWSYANNHDNFNLIDTKSPTSIIRGQIQFRYFLKDNDKISNITIKIWKYAPLLSQYSGDLITNINMIRSNNTFIGEINLSDGNYAYLLKIYNDNGAKKTFLDPFNPAILIFKTRINYRSASFFKIQNGFIPNNEFDFDNDFINLYHYEQKVIDNMVFVYPKTMNDEKFDIMTNLYEKVFYDDLSFFSSYINSEYPYYKTMIIDQNDMTSRYKSLFGTSNVSFENLAIYSFSDFNYSYIGTHEAVHILFGELTTSTHNKDFLNEGFASAFDGTQYKYERNYYSIVSSFIKANLYIPISDLALNFREHFDFITYPIAAVFTLSLIESFGPEKYHTFINMYYYNLEQFKSNFTTVYGIELNEFEQRIKEESLRYEIPEVNKEIIVNIEVFLEKFKEEITENGESFLTNTDNMRISEEAKSILSSLSIQELNSISIKGIVHNYVGVYRVQIGNFQGKDVYLVIWTYKFTLDRDETQIARISIRAG